MALSSASRELLSVQRLFESIRLDPECDCSILCDNKQTVGIITNDHPQLTTKMRHIDIHHLWIRQEFHKGKISVSWVSTNEQPADGFTKALSLQNHRKFIQFLGLCETNDYEA